MNSIKGKAFSSVIWKFLERILAQGISLVVSVLIARILNPDDYSVVSVVTIFFAFANIIISGGLNTALVQKKIPMLKIIHLFLFLACVFL